MATKKTESEPKVDLVKAREEGLTVLTPLQKLAVTLTITTEVHYLEADELFARITKAEKDWDGKVTPAIDSIRKGLDLLYDLRSSIAKPLNDAKALIKGKMKAYKEAEAKRLQAEEAERLAEIKRLEDEAKAKEEALNKAKTQPLKQKLIQQRAQAEQDAALLKSVARLGGVRGSSSQTRKTKTWKVTDLALLMAYIIENGEEDLTSLVQINSTELSAYFRIKDPKVGPWLPGVEVMEEMNITGRATK